jgi:hypothetical protein
MKANTKIFCIGLNKTGTTSLHAAFQKIGFKSVHFKEKNGTDIKDLILKNWKNGNKLLEGIEQYDAYSDWNSPSTNFLFKELDKQYPDSKFILNTRNLEDWLKSREKHVRRIPNFKRLQIEHPSNSWFAIDKTVWKKEYFEHHNNVYEYFKERENDLLEFDVTKGDDWDKLCNFLNVKVPKITFPKSNTAIGNFKNEGFKQNLKIRLNNVIKQLTNNKRY